MEGQSLNFVDALSEVSHLCDACGSGLLDVRIKEHPGRALFSGQKFPNLSHKVSAASTTIGEYLKPLTIWAHHSFLVKRDFLCSYFALMNADCY